MKIIIDEDAPVIRPNFGTGQIDVRDKKYTDCQHRAIEVDEHSVQCKTCKKVLNPIAVLLDIATKERRLRSWEVALNDLHKEIATLKEERARLKSAIRRSKP